MQAPKALHTLILIIVVLLSLVITYEVSVVGARTVPAA